MFHLSKLINHILGLADFKISRISKAKQSNLQNVSPFQWLRSYNCDIIIDVGANEGQFIDKISSVFPCAEFFCFEPLAVPFAILRNKFGERSDFTLYNFALGESEGDKKFNVNEYSPSSSFLEMQDLHKVNFGFAIDSIKRGIEVRLLDDVIKVCNENRVLLKLDVQGYEINVLKGAEIILANVDVILVEVSFVELYIGQPMFADIYSYLADRGFKYMGNIEQLLSPQDSQILQADALFVRASS